MKWTNRTQNNRNASMTKEGSMEGKRVGVVMMIGVTNYRAYFVKPVERASEKGKSSIHTSPSSTVGARIKWKSWRRRRERRGWKRTLERSRDSRVINVTDGTRLRQLSPSIPEKYMSVTPTSNQLILLWEVISAKLSTNTNLCLFPSTSLFSLQWTDYRQSSLWTVEGRLSPAQNVKRWWTLEWTCASTYVTSISLLHRINGRYILRHWRTRRSTMWDRDRTIYCESRERKL